MEPSLIILGAQKAGTTALYEMLQQHPRMLTPNAKELNFFNDDETYAKGMRFYRSMFPPIPVKVSGYLTFEASPSYLYQATVSAPRIARELPKATCVAVLRDPVKRAYSSWNMSCAFLHKPHPLGLPENRSFAQAVEDEMAGRTADARHKYLLRSCYAEQVKTFQSHIRPEKLMIRSYLDLKRDPAGLINAICNQLGLEKIARDSAITKTRSNVRAYAQPLDPGLAKELYQYFTPEMERLKEVLGYELEIMEGHA
jgi:hypothetical protein